MSIDDDIKDVECDDENAALELKRLDAERAEIAIPEPEEGLTREDIPAEAARIAPRRQEEQRRLEQRGPSKDPSPY
jgi:hypothetical protein